MGVDESNYLKVSKPIVDRSSDWKSVRSGTDNANELQEVKVDKSKLPLDQVDGEEVGAVLRVVAKDRGADVLTTGVALLLVGRVRRQLWQGQWYHLPLWQGQAVLGLWVMSEGSTAVINRCLFLKQRHLSAVALLLTTWSATSLWCLEQHGSRATAKTR
jgi:hypothetical protein